VHYCKTLEATETVAKKFLNDKILGFDLEWKAQASAADGIQNNVSLIQLANKERIALFHVAMFKPARNIKDLVSPSLKHILKSPDITKVGVSIKADCTRVRKYLGIEVHAIFELSHLFKVVKYCHSNPKLINKRLVNLSDQVNEHFGLPLAKGADVRCSDWTTTLGYTQVQCKHGSPPTNEKSNAGISI
jgi:ribonuclease D